MISSIPKQGTVPPEAARIIARRLGERMRPLAIYLFGSHARGDAGPESDLDILMVVPDSSQPRYVRSIEARRAVGDIHVPKDIVVLTQREWDEERSVVCSLASTVWREGIRLYG